MKRLSILRHAKSNWSNSELRDIDRPLNKRGRNAAVLIGRYINENGLLPELVLCSTAVRTRQTAAQVFGGANDRPKIKFDAELYLAAPSTIIRKCQNASNEFNHIMVVSHNPGSQDAVLTLADATSTPKDRLAEISAKFPTAAIASMVFDVESWEGVRSQAGRLTHFMTPKQLAQR